MNIIKPEKDIILKPYRIRLPESIYGHQTREDRQIQKAERRRQMKKPARGGGRP